MATLKNARSRVQTVLIKYPLLSFIITLMFKTLSLMSLGGDVKDNNVRIFVAELIGTMVLVLGGCGTAILATGAFNDGLNVGALGVSIAFGLSVLIMAYAIGSISGCHINPAVTLGLVLAKKVKASLLPIYWVAQVAGGIVGALIIKIIVSGNKDFRMDAGDVPGAFATNGFDELSPGGFSLGAVAVAEIVLTAIFVLVVIHTTWKAFPAGFGGLTAGLTITLIHLISIPVSNTSVNPARSLGVALFQGKDQLNQVWAFIVFPLVGAIIAAVISLFLLPEDKSVATAS